MIVCQCNRISDRDVVAMQAAGARDIVEVHEGLGKKPNCGGCLIGNQRTFFGEASERVTRIAGAHRDARRCGDHA